MADAERAADESRTCEAERAALGRERDGAEEAMEAARGHLQEARAAAATALERLRHADDLIATARGGASSVSDRRRAVLARGAAAEHAATVIDARDTRAAALADAEGRLRALLAETDFASAEALSAALRNEGERTRLTVRVRRHDDELLQVRGTIDRLTAADLPADPVDLAPIETHHTAMRTELALTQQHAARLEQLRASLARAVQAAGDAQRQTGEAATRLETVRRLADAVNGLEPNTMKMTLETFVLAAELEEIVAAANVRLDDMSAGRYRLAHTDERAAHGAASGLGIEVIDAHTGRGRPASSLSGGETFLASLALALGLAEVVTARAGGIRLDTLFIDEGFGSLDAETLDTAMRTLDSLRAGGRTVGVISHVEAMHHQIPARLAVTVQIDGSSIVSQDTGSASAR